jgi:hypothetical protein
MFIVDKHPFLRRIFICGRATKSGGVSLLRCVPRSVIALAIRRFDFGNFQQPSAPTSIFGATANNRLAERHFRSVVEPQARPAPFDKNS